MLLWLSDRNNVTFLIAVIGFVISIYNFLSSTIQNRTKLQIDIPNIFRMDNNKRCFDILQVKIINLSSQPIVISGISAWNKNSNGSFGNLRREIMSSTRSKGREIIREQYWMSDTLPIRIDGNSCVNLLLISDCDKPIITKDAWNIIKFNTSKRSILRFKKVNAFSNQWLLTECREPN